jgi:hypothetical protein
MTTVPHDKIAMVFRTKAGTDGKLDKKVSTDASQDGSPPPPPQGARHTGPPPHLPPPLCDPALPQEFADLVTQLFKLVGAGNGGKAH